MKGYRVGWLGWKIAAKFGLPLVIKGKIFFDDEDKVWIATSDDFLPEHHFICEADTYEDLQKEIVYMALDVLDCVFENEAIKRKNNEVFPLFKTVPPMALA